MEYTHVIKVRREIELEAVRFKGAQLSAKRSPPPSPSNQREELEAKQFEAEQRRAEQLKLKVSTAAKACVPRGAVSSPRATRADADAKAAAAEERRAEMLKIKVSKAAESCVPRGAPSSPRATQADVDAKQAEAERRRAALTEEKIAKAHRCATPRKDASSFSPPVSPRNSSRATIEAKLESAEQRRLLLLAARVTKAEEMSHLTSAQASSTVAGEGGSSSSSTTTTTTTPRRAALAQRLADASARKSSADAERSAKAALDSERVAEAATRLEGEQQRKADHLRLKQCEAEMVRARHLRETVEKARQLGTKAVDKVLQKRDEDEARVVADADAGRLALERRLADAAERRVEAALLESSKFADREKRAADAKMNRQHLQQPAASSSRLAEEQDALVRAADELKRKVDTAALMGSSRVDDAKRRKAAIDEQIQALPLKKPVVEENEAAPATSPLKLGACVFALTLAAAIIARIFA